MSELIPTKHLQIRFKFHDVLILLVAAALIGWCMFVLPSINISYDKIVIAIAGATYLIIESMTTLMILKLKRIKSKDDFSSMPCFFAKNKVC